MIYDVGLSITESSALAKVKREREKKKSLLFSGIKWRDHFIAKFMFISILKVCFEL